MSISQTKKVSRLVMSREDLFRRAQDLASELKTLCFKRLWPSDSSEMTEIRLQGTMISYYPQYNLFMPSFEWINERLNSNHTKDSCLKEVEAIQDLAHHMPECLSPVMKKLRRKDSCSRASVLSSLFRGLNNSSAISYKALLEDCEIVTFGKDEYDNLERMVNSLWGHSNGTCIPIICPRGGVWRSVRKDEVLDVLACCGVEVDDKELAPLLDSFTRINAALPQCEACGVSWDEIVQVLSETNKHSDALLESESIRMNHQRLSEKVLKDPNQGHWDAWPTNSSESDNIDVQLDEAIYARNPLVDVDKTAIIGIDFGTKSTIVAKWSSGDPEVLRIGLDDFTKTPEPHHYENPTMMEFIDIKSFQKTYIGKRGRPHTRWADLKTSHEAGPESLGSGWVDFCSAGKNDGISYLYYTRDGGGQTGGYKVKDAFCKPVEFDPSEGRILIRASGVSEIEWCVGSVTNDGKCRPNKNSTPKKIQLVERS